MRTVTPGPAPEAEDYAEAYTIPAPPPIPGLIDKLTPQFDTRSQSGPKPRPVYLDATPASTARDTPVPRKRGGAPAPVPDDDERPSRGPILLVALLIGVFGLGVMTLLAVVVAISLFGGGDDEALEAEVTEEQIVPVRNNMTQKPALIGVPTGDEVEAPPTEGVTPAPATGTETPSLPAPGPAPTPRPSTPAVAAPAPTAPKTAPRPAPAAAQPATKGILKIRSNRRVLVYIDGQASGYTPLEMKVEPGQHSVVAMVPGQPNTKQEREASVAAGGDTVAVDFAF